jgi:hypothetical protein
MERLETIIAFKEIYIYIYIIYIYIYIYHNHAVAKVDTANDSENLRQKD